MKNRLDDGWDKRKRTDEHKLILIRTYPYTHLLPSPNPNTIKMKDGKI